MGSSKAARRTPQDKKQISYAKDRRNSYGENDKSSRKNIRRRKKLVNRANRHRDAQTLGDVAGRVDLSAAGKAEQQVLGKRPKRWRKHADVSLGAHVEARVSRWKELTPRAEAALRRLRRNRQARRAARVCFSDG